MIQRKWAGPLIAACAIVLVVVLIAFQGDEEIPTADGPAGEGPESNAAASPAVPGDASAPVGTGPAGADPSFDSATAGGPGVSASADATPGNDGPRGGPGEPSASSGDPGDETALRPPMDAPPIGPPSLAAEMNQLMRQIAEGGGPPMDEHAAALLASEDPLMRALGAALMGSGGPLPEDVLQQVAADGTLEVPLMVLGWLEDTGNADQAAALAALLRERGVSANDLAGLVGSGTLDSVAARAALDLLRNELPADDMALVLAETAIDMDQHHSVRMKALMLLRDTMDFEDYRRELQIIADNTHGIDPLWDESLRRLQDRVQGPAEVLAGPPTLTPSRIHELVAREYPAMLDDLAQHIEYVLENADGAAAEGTAETLDEYLNDFEKRPWDGEQQFTIKRLRGMLEDLKKFESETRQKVIDDRPPF